MNTQETIKALSDITDNIHKRKDILVEKSNYDGAEVLIDTIVDLKLIIKQLQEGEKDG